MSSSAIQIPGLQSCALPQFCSSYQQGREVKQTPFPSSRNKHWPRRSLLWHKQYIWSLHLKTQQSQTVVHSPFFYYFFFFFNLILFSGQNIKQCWVLAPWIGTGKVQWTKKLNFIFHFLRLRALQLHVWCCQLSWQQKNLRVCLCSWWGKCKERRKYRLILLLHKKSTKEIFPFLFHFYKVFSYWHMQCMHTKKPKPSKQKKSGLSF